MVLLRVLDTLKALRSEVEHLRAETQPLLAELRSSVDEARGDLERFDRVLGSAEAISGAVVQSGNRVSRHGAEHAGDQDGGAGRRGHVRRTAVRTVWRRRACQVGKRCEPWADRSEIDMLNGDLVRGRRGRRGGRSDGGEEEVKKRRRPVAAVKAAKQAVSSVAIAGRIGRRGRTRRP